MFIPQIYLREIFMLMKHKYGLSGRLFDGGSFSFLCSGVPGFIRAGSVCDALPAEGDLNPASVPPVVPGLRHGGRARPGLHGQEGAQEARGAARSEGGQTPQQAQPEEHVPLPN